MSRKKSEYRKAFADNLRDLRLSVSKTQAELCEELGLSQTAVAQWETDRNWPQMDQVIALADYFGVAIDDMIHRSPRIPARGVIIVPATTRKRAPKRPKKPAKKRVRKKK